MPSGAYGKVGEYAPGEENAAWRVREGLEVRAGRRKCRMARTERLGSTR